MRQPHNPPARCALWRQPGAGLHARWLRNVLRTANRRERAHLPPPSTLAAHCARAAAATWIQHGTSLLPNCGRSSSAHLSTRGAGGVGKGGGGQSQRSGRRNHLEADAAAVSARLVQMGAAATRLRVDQHGNAHTRAHASTAACCVQRAQHAAACSCRLHVHGEPLAFDHGPCPRGAHHAAANGADHRALLRRGGHRLLRMHRAQR
jgi:hypothetical protein